MNTNSDLQKHEWNYDIYLTGSDQIWAHSIPEFVSSKEDTRGAYYFEFVDGYKISYASSTGEATFEDLVPYKDLIEKFSHIAVREQRGKELLQRLTGRNIETVLDPTYLVLHKQWCEIASQSKCLVDQKYIFIYSLQGRKKAKVWKEVIRSLHDQLGLDVVSVSPFAPISGKHIINKVDAGPEEILSLFANAEYILTDTFHGMSFSIHFRKQFALLESKGTDYRKKNVLEKFALVSRVATNPEECCRVIANKIDYLDIEDKIDREVEHSRLYLKKALDGYANY